MKFLPRISREDVQKLSVEELNVKLRKIYVENLQFRSDDEIYNTQYNKWQILTQILMTLVPYYVIIRLIL
jgi:hypothetical protein